MTETPSKKICFAILVHENQELVQELIDNVTYYCPNSSIVLYNGGNDKSLCNNINIPVCPTSKKLKYGFTTIHLIEIMEWLEYRDEDYDYLINVDSDALFIKHGYEAFIADQMKDADYMAVDFRITGKDYYCGNQLKKDKKRWKSLFNIKPLYGVFNVGQVMSRSFIKTILGWEKVELFKSALLETPAFGTDEIVFANLAMEFGFRAKCYPSTEKKPKYKTIGWDMYKLLNRYRPHITIQELIDCLNKDSDHLFLCHPIYRKKSDPVRQLINRLQNRNVEDRFKINKYPWFHNEPANYSTSLSIDSSYGNEEIIVRVNNTLTHYYKKEQNWYSTNTFAKGASGSPLFYESTYRNFEVISSLEHGGVAHWWRNNNSKKLLWLGPNLITSETVEPILLTQLADGKHCFVGKKDRKIVYWIRDDMKTWNWIKIN